MDNPPCHLVSYMSSGFFLDSYLAFVSLLGLLILSSLLILRGVYSYRKRLDGHGSNAATYSKRVSNTKRTHTASAGAKLAGKKSGFESTSEVVTSRLLRSRGRNVCLNCAWWPPWNGGLVGKERRARTKEVARFLVTVLLPPAAAALSVNGSVFYKKNPALSGSLLKPPPKWATIILII